MSALPERAAEGLGAGAGNLVGGPLAVRRGVVEANLRIAYPDAPDAWIRERRAPPTGTWGARPRPSSACRGWTRRRW